MGTATASQSVETLREKGKDVLRGTYLGHLPTEPGNYYCFDVMTTEQYMGKVFEGPEGRLQVLSGKDHQVHELSEFDHPNIRWIQIEPLTRANIDKYLAVPA